MTLALLAGAALFVVAAILGEYHALFIPAVVLIAAATLEAIAGPLL